MATLSYTATPYSSFSIAQAISGLYDGNTTSGFRAEGVGTSCQFKITFSQLSTLSSIELWIQQFNGNYNGFAGFELWNSTKTVKYYDTTSLGYGYWLLTLTNVPAATEYICVCKNLYTTNCSLAELKVSGLQGFAFITNASITIAGSLQQCAGMAFFSVGGVEVSGEMLQQSGQEFLLGSDIVIGGAISLQTVNLNATLKCNGRCLYELIGDNLLASSVNSTTFIMVETTPKFVMTEV